MLNIYIKKKKSNLWITMKLCPTIIWKDKIQKLIKPKNKNQEIREKIQQKTITTNIDIMVSKFCKATSYQSISYKQKTTKKSTKIKQINNNKEQIFFIIPKSQVLPVSLMTFSSMLHPKWFQVFHLKSKNTNTNQTSSQTKKQWMLMMMNKSTRKWENVWRDYPMGGVKPRPLERRFLLLSSWSENSLEVMLHGQELKKKSTMRSKVLILFFIAHWAVVLSLVGWNFSTLLNFKGGICIFTTKFYNYIYTLVN